MFYVVCYCLTVAGILAMKYVHTFQYLVLVKAIQRRLNQEFFVTSCICNVTALLK